MVSVSEQNPHEFFTIIIVLRDRFSTTVRCLSTLIANAPETYTLTVVFGGVPHDIQETLIERFGKKARFIFEPQFCNPAEYRNIGLRETKTRLAVLMDNDVYVRPGWLEPLLECQRETGAAMVVPLVLEAEHIIHTAGNDLLTTYQKGKPYGQKVLLL